MVKENGKGKGEASSAWSIRIQPLGITAIWQKKNHIKSIEKSNNLKATVTRLLGNLEKHCCTGKSHHRAILNPQWRIGATRKTTAVHSLRCGLGWLGKSSDILRKEIEERKGGNGETGKQVEDWRQMKENGISYADGVHLIRLR